MSPTLTVLEVAPGLHATGAADVPVAAVVDAPGGDVVGDAVVPVAFLLLLLLHAANKAAAATPMMSARRVDTMGPPSSPCAVRA